MLVPLTQIKILSIAAQIRAGKLRARDSILSEPTRRIVAPKITIIVGPFTDRESKSLARGYRRPRNSGRIRFVDDRPGLHVDRIDPTKIARAHPQSIAMRGQRLRGYRR